MSRFKARQYEYTTQTLMKARTVDFYAVWGYSNDIIPSRLNLDEKWQLLNIEKFQKRGLQAGGFVVL
jgi:hypothetical protein